MSNPPLPDTHSAHRTIFGPIHSRRFGVSLGVDLSPDLKQCNFDCLYCELAPAHPIAHQTRIVPVDTVLSELKTALETHSHIDVITLTANGEPTMYPYLAELVEGIDAIKGNVETLILSNAAALSDPDVFETLLKLDGVKLSLDAVTPSVFRKIDRPAEGIEIGAIVDAIERFSRRFEGKLFIEILFVRGLNDTPEEIEALNRVLMGIRAERIDIGTVDRPPAYPVEGLSYDALYALSQGFDPSLPIHIVSRTHAQSAPQSYSDAEILATLDKRPLTREDINALFDDESLQRFERLRNAGQIVSLERSNIVFFLPSQNIGRKRDKKPPIS